jgi:hypothetical protein
LNPSPLLRGRPQLANTEIVWRARAILAKKMIRDDTMQLLRCAAFYSVMTVLALVATTSAARGSEIYGLGGAVQSLKPFDTSYSWQLEYRQDLLKHLAAGVSYLNEGHFKEHHRDGYTAQFWTRAELLDYRLTLAAGAGPYFFLDTTSSSAHGGFTDDHGWKAMLSAAATWHLENNLLLELRSNWVHGPSGFDTVSALAGIGYHFEPTLETIDAKKAPPEQQLHNEVTIFAGQTIVNSLDSQKSLAAAVEFRRHLSRHIDWTLAGLYEGDNRLVRRDGLLAQLWVTQELLDDALSVGAGAGAYFNLSHYHNPFQGSGADRFLSGLIALTGSYRVTPRWALRASWNRIVTSYERDTDVILGGVGYRF